MAKVTITDIMTAAVYCSGLSGEVLFGRSKKRKIVRWRQVAMVAAIEETNSSKSYIGRRFSRDHTSVLHAAKSIGRLIREGSRSVPVMLWEVKAAAEVFARERKMLHKMTLQSIPLVQNAAATQAGNLRAPAPERTAT